MNANAQEFLQQYAEGKRNFRFANLQDADLQGANLRGADLYGADLRDANLQGVKLQGVKLRGANLQGANLRDANLRGANLQGVNLCGADLYGADLDGVNLRDADLRDANLQCANLYGANLYSANLQGVNLCGANLQGINLQGANLRGAKEIPASVAAAYLVPPEKGEFTAYKKVRAQKGRACIAELLIPADAKRSSATTRKCRASAVITVAFYSLEGEVLDDEVIAHKGGFGPETVYKVGERTHPDRWDNDRWKECSHGIHFFLTFQEAADWRW